MEMNLKNVLLSNETGKKLDNQQILEEIKKCFNGKNYVKIAKKDVASGDGSIKDEDENEETKVFDSKASSKADEIISCDLIKVPKIIGEPKLIVDAITKADLNVSSKFENNENDIPSDSDGNDIATVKIQPEILVDVFCQQKEFMEKYKKEQLLLLQRGVLQTEEIMDILDRNMNENDLCQFKDCIVEADYISNSEDKPMVVVATQTDYVKSAVEEEYASKKMDSFINVALALLNLVLIGTMFFGLSNPKAECLED